VVAGRSSARSAGRLAVALVLSLLAPGSALAQQEVVDEWDQKLARAEEQLRAGEHKKARRAARDLLAVMTEVVGTGPAAEQLVGRAGAALALAEAGLGDVEAALWDWQVAGALLPSLATLDLAPYGEAGTRLAAAAAAAPAPAESSGGPAPVVRKKGRAVEIPLARLVACAESPAAQASAEARVTVGLDGRPRAPRLDAADPLLSRAALEALRTWTFEPALAAGRPVEAPFALVTTLEPKRCRDLLATRRPARGGGDPGGGDEE
jgi:hypothetical protein